MRFRFPVLLGSWEPVWSAWLPCAENSAAESCCRKYWREGKIMFRRFRIRLITVIAAALVFLGASALAIGVAPISVGSTDGTREKSRFLFNPILNGWSVGPYEVSANPDAGPWVKKFENPFFDGSAFDDSSTFAMVETLIVSGGLKWTGWQEKIRTPGWKWMDGGLVAINPDHDGQNGFAAKSPNNDTANRAFGLNDNGILIDPIVSKNGRRMSFDFDNPLEDGTLIFIWKMLAYEDKTTPSDTQWIKVVEKPNFVPIPGAVWLMLSGLIAVFTLRKYRKYKFP
jgi:hypothetical protein